MNMPNILLAASAISGIIYITGWLIMGAKALKRWVHDEQAIHYNKSDLAQWVHNNLFGGSGKVEYGLELIVVCFLLFVAIAILMGVAQIPGALVVIAILVGIAIAVFVGAHAARYAVRTKRSLNEIGKETHKHNEEEITS